VWHVFCVVLLITTSRIHKMSIIALYSTVSASR